VKDKKGSRFGSKTATLEALGLLLPFLTAPDLVRGRHVVLKVDNISLVYGWDKRYLKVDEEASILIRSLHLLGCLLECQIRVVHIGRLSDDKATLVDHWTRLSTVKSEDEKAVKVGWRKLRGALSKWLVDPATDWSLPVRLAEEVESTL